MLAASNCRDQAELAEKVCISIVMTTVRIRLGSDSSGSLPGAEPGRRRSAERSSAARYFAVFLLLFFAAARRSVFLRRAARFLTLSLPWLFPIRPQHSSFLGRFQAVSMHPLQTNRRFRDSHCKPASHESDR